MSYRGVTFNKQMCKSEDDAIIFHTFLNGCAGKVLGCSVTYDQTSVYMAQGYFMVYGRLVNVLGAETLTPTAIQTGRQYNRLVFTIDLSKDNTAMEFRQGYFEFLTSYDAMPGVTQEDLFSGGNLYQIPIASFTLTVNGITNFKDEMGSVNIQEVWNTANTDLSQYREQFELFFDEQKQDILQMIQDLEDQDFITNAEFNAIAITKDNIGQQTVKKAGSSDTATALTSNAGSATQPVYFSGGRPVACTRYANASVKYADSAGSAGYATSAGSAPDSIARNDIKKIGNSVGLLTAQYTARTNKAIPDISLYRSLYIALIDSAQEVVVDDALIPYTIFKIGTRRQLSQYYNSYRYGDISFINNTTVQVEVSSGVYIAVYGVDPK